MSNIYHNSRKSSELRENGLRAVVGSRLYLVPSAVEVLEELERRIDPQIVQQVVANQFQETAATAREEPVAAVVPVEAPAVDADRVASAKQRVMEAFDDVAA